MTKEKFLVIKEMLKSEAKELRVLKDEIKSAMRDGSICTAPNWNFQSKLETLRYDWRHKHIAYCLIKGRSIEEIEPYCSKDNPRNDNLIEKYRKEFEGENEQQS